MGGNGEDEPAVLGDDGGAGGIAADAAAGVAVEGLAGLTGIAVEVEAGFEAVLVVEAKDLDEGVVLNPHDPFFGGVVAGPFDGLKTGDIQTVPFESGLDTLDINGAQG